MNKLFKSFETMDRPTPLPRRQSRYYDDDSEYASDGESSASPASARKNLNEDDDTTDEFEEMLLTGESDVTIVTSDKTFHAHRVMLSSQSTVFSERFAQDKLNNVPNSNIDEKDLTGNVMKEVLRSIYIGEAENLEEMAHEILGPANKYALTDLKTVCEDIMINNLNTENASEYFVLSSKHKADKLRSRVREFVVANTKSITNTPGFEAMIGDNSVIIADLLNAYLETKANIKDH